MSNSSLRKYMRGFSRLFKAPKYRSLEPPKKHFITRHEVQKSVAETVASVDGKHYTDYVEAVKSLKKEGKLDEAITLLLRLVAATEAESAVTGLGVAPWYYEQLAIIYHKQVLPLEERAILERYAGQPKAPGAMPAKLAKWLQSLKEPRSED
jgi:hypothetical protein